ncbi:CobD/CbiB family protein [Ampullimonas aquatilis]|uniref:CobD/CbiB family protein n=1 Tax=Ampullimonas aquatilis TaxID=1341549 RepID=UPI003C723515
MTFFSILIALAIEQIKSLGSHNPVYEAVRVMATGAERRLNAGEILHGRVAWFLVMIPLLLLAAIPYWILLRINPAFALLWNVVVLYLTLGFRQFSHPFTEIQLALSNGQLDEARRRLSDWLNIDAADFDTSEVCRRTIEAALLASHRHVFGVFFWFLLPIGPAGAVLYRVAEYLARSWNRPDQPEEAAFGHFAKMVFEWIDWLPARLTAVGFAIVGNFEDALYAWRNFASDWGNRTAGIILAAASGALGVHLQPMAKKNEGASPLVPEAAALQKQEDVYSETGIFFGSTPRSLTDFDPGAEPPGDAPTTKTLQSAVGLVWRAVVLWMLMLFMITVAVWLS